MSVITRMRNQTAVYWRRGTGTDLYGNRDFEPPVEIKCRWTDEKQEFINERGESQFSKAVVYVDRDVNIGDMLFLGSLDDLTQRYNPEKETGAHRIEGWKKTPNFKATEFLRKALL